MVRRSVVFGLGRVRQPWAIEILEKLQMEDKEWIVRNAAIQALEEIRQPNPHIPRALPSLTETAWLVEFASKQGLGVTSGEQAESLVLQALKSGTEDERLQAMEFLALKGKSDIAASVYAPFFGSAGDQREAAYQALWLMSLSGVELPPPKQFGYA
jgi:HEAT repeat protein